METAASPTTVKPKSRRRWFRFSLRTALVTVALLSVWLGVKVQEARRQQSAVAAMLKLGVWIDYDYEYDPQNANPGHYVPNATPSGPAWLRRMLGDDFFRSVYTVSFPQSFDANPVTDADLQRLEGFARLNTLVLHGTRVTDAGLANLKGFTSLEDLDLRDTSVTDAGLGQIGGLSKLELLWLSGTQVTDAGLEQLTGLPHLRGLWLQGTKVTAAGLARFKNASPNCQIIRDYP